MSRQLWRPSTDSDGIPYETLCTFSRALLDWRERYLSIVGVPSNFEGEWDFVSVSTFKGFDNPSTKLSLGCILMCQRRYLSCDVDHSVQRRG